MKWSPDSVLVSHGKAARVAKTGIGQSVFTSKDIPNAHFDKRDGVFNGDNCSIQTENSGTSNIPGSTAGCSDSLSCASPSNPKANERHNMTDQEKLSRNENIGISEGVGHPHRRDLVWGTDIPVAEDAVSDTSTAALIDFNDYDVFDTPPRDATQADRMLYNLDAEYIDGYAEPSSVARNIEKRVRKVVDSIGWSVLAAGLITMSWHAWTCWRDAKKLKAARAHARNWLFPAS